MDFNCLISITNNGYKQQRLFDTNVLRSISLIKEYLDHNIEFDGKEIQLNSNRITMEAFESIFDYRQCLLNNNTTIPNMRENL